MQLKPFFKSSIKQGESNFSYHKLKYGYSRKIDYSFDNVKLYKILEKAILKHPEIIVSDDKRQSIIERETKLDEEYFKIKEELASIKEKIQYIEKYLFVELPKRHNSQGQFLYIGNTYKNIPNGYGYLINEKKQLIAVGYWDDGFPIVLYNVNIFHNPESTGKDYVYYGKSFSTKHASRYLYLNNHGYKNENVNTFKLYFGGYIFVPGENANYLNGYGCYFYSAWEKTDKQYYVGNYKNSNRDGKGTHHHDKSFTYEGAWENGSLNFGTITSKTDKSVYTGEIKDWRMNGEGKKAYTNGKVEEGIFENGYFKMTKKQYVEELNRKEQERIAEERRQEEIRIAQEEAQRNSSRIDSEKALKALEDFVNQSKNSSSTSNNGTNTYSNKVTNSANCRSCSGTGICKKCSNVVNKPYLERCSVKSNKAVNNGYVLCSTCNGYGYKLASASQCNCPNGIGSCPGETCYSCKGTGWYFCNECNSCYGGCKDLGKCKACKGTGKDR